MEGLKLDGIQIMQFLFSGFLATWVYYGLTGFKKPEGAERLIEALIYTVFAQAAMAGEVVCLLHATTDPDLEHNHRAAFALLNALNAMLIGTITAFLATNDGLFRLLRWLRITRQRGGATEWFTAFISAPRYVVLHLKDGRRLYGYPKEYPIISDQGHFLMERTAWIPDDGAPPIDLPCWGLLIKAKDVKWVELMKLSGETNDPPTSQPSQSAVAAQSPATRARNFGSP